ncbi:-like protein [Stylonychia lemnae]|uniref:-like protein n=1 Tax=Stylonychia lemnae TaxID=5949 RepID=A0A078AUC7_STYLE|nr:-like protein [Stylonychia lemnae]|eukprot:CDW84453.1 -like protein [Stylonychia lemnae]
MFKYKNLRIFYLSQLGLRSFSTQHIEAYRILGISEQSSKQEIKEAFRKLAQLYHPDGKQGDSKRFLEVKNSYDQILKERFEKDPAVEDSDNQSQGQNKEKEEAMLRIRLRIKAEMDKKKYEEQVKKQEQEKMIQENLIKLQKEKDRDRA